MPVRKGYRVYRGFVAILVRKAIRVVKARRETWVRRDPQVPLARLARQVRKAMSAHRVQEGFPAPQARQVRRGLWARRV